MSPNVQKPEFTCFILQNNSLTPVAQALASLTTQSQESPSQAKTPSNSEEDAPKAVKPNISISEVLRDIKSDLTIPLDLSIRRLSSKMARERSLSFSSAISGEAHTPMDLELMLEGKENLSTVGSNSGTPEQIVCAPSLPGSPPLTPSPKRRSNSPRVSNLSPNSQHAAIIRSIPPELSIHFQAEHLIKQRIPPLINHQNNAANIGENHKRPQLTPPLLKLPSPSPIMANVSVPNLPPQIFVKQGVSKCKECNIVFCKYENYVAHKKHYCSARNLEEIDGGASKSPPQISPQAAASPGSQISKSANRGNSAPPIASLPYQQLICAACGTKFTSLDNLGAHQMYYCSKRVDLSAHVSFVHLFFGLQIKYEFKFPEKLCYIIIK